MKHYQIKKNTVVLVYVYLPENLNQNCVQRPEATPIAITQCCGKIIVDIPSFTAGSEVFESNILYGDVHM